MTYLKAITPNPDTETAPQSCGDDPFGLNDIPAFLRRTPESVRAASLCSGRPVEPEAMGS